MLTPLPQVAQPNARPRRGSWQSLWAALSASLLLIQLTGAQLTDAAMADEPYGRHQADDVYRDHWSYISVVRPEVPAVKNAAWARGPMDRFVLAAQEKAGLEPAAEVARATLLRRAYLDLIGLPPTVVEQAAFLADDSADAFEKVVESLLARPEYGERWGRHWLDVVRYAESNGYERDGPKPSVWRYRDYVIQAFNQDKPYDRFLIEQLAGDELPDANAETHIATTFLRLGTFDDEPADPLVDRYDQLDDVLGITCSTFMAQSLRCARCHDHKFEVFSQRDYTRMLANFTPLKRPQRDRDDLDRLVGTRDEVAAYLAATNSADAQQADLQQQIVAHEHATARRLQEAGQLAQATVASTAADGTVTPPLLTTEDLQVILQAPPERKPEDVERLIKCHEKLRTALSMWATAEENAKLQQLDAAVQAVNAARPAPPLSGYVWFEDSQTAEPVHVFTRGDPRTPAEQVDAGFPAIFVDAPPPAATPTTSSTGRRLQLAQWLATAEHPLTARVMVNRIWQWHFGDGLVRSENDFGVMGESPTNPALLDWLAAEFVEQGWSIKHLHRLMVLSSTYRQSPTRSTHSDEKDPHNNLLSHWSPRRLEAEAVRDSLLAVSGQLNPERGGPSVFPKIAPAVLASQSRPGNGWETSDPKQVARRSVYVFVKRTLLVPELEVMDFPDTNAACEQRVVSTVAPQALTFFNGEFTHETAHALAQRLISEQPGDSSDLSVRDARIKHAFALALARAPEDTELAAVRSFLSDQTAQIAADLAATGALPDTAAQKAIEAFCLVLLNTNEFVYLQ